MIVVSDWLWQWKISYGDVCLFVVASFNDIAEMVVDYYIDCLSWLWLFVLFVIAMVGLLC